ncbi:MAG: aconitate hydratase [Magnetococcales bacterium]|nr:aconitate hydratase [Magnetococcales bacterium]|tara:strand:+ start:3235 stop:5499 length:2265 start_codon:yes stop_codon:yes gene_type:complete
MQIESTPAFVEAVYKKTEENLKIVRERLKRPLTYAEKIIYGHLDDPQDAELEHGTSYIKVRPNRIALQDATAQMAILQFMLAGKSSAAVPVTVHCDHLIRAHTGAKDDLATANSENKEVYNFLSSASSNYDFGFWKPGAGIIHQVVLEQYAFPGLMMLGTDSHTPNAGGLGAFACGVGGADAVDVMVDMPWEVLHPKIVGVRLTGELKGWAAPKDIILKLLGILTCAGGTNRVIEYFGEGVQSISCTGKATICNMGAELGATTSIFPYDKRMSTYLGVTNRKETAELADKYTHLLCADDEVLAKPEDFYEMVIDINLSELEPHIVGPHSPDLAVPVSGMKKHMEEGGWPKNLTSALIGSCTNSSYEDMGRVAEMAEQLSAKGAKLKMPLLITPGSEQVHQTIIRDGQLASLEKLGATVLANACGPCIGQWKRDDIEMGEENSIVSSYNRNFPKRNDGNPQTCSFIGSPETTLAYALFGRLDVDPYNTDIEAADGTKFRLNAPENVAEVPADGFVKDEAGYQKPADGKVDVVVDENSERLERLTPFDKWSGEDYKGLRLLLKAQGKCTTDHISPAGPWLKFRGHLDNISDNMFNGAINAFSGEAGFGKNPYTEEKEQFSKIARAIKAKGEGWVAVGDNNYGEGSSREHAAMSPRLLGCRAVITRSFARIHETNLKKQGVLPLTFVNESDYELIEEGDKIDLVGLKDLAPGSRVKAVVTHADGSTVEIELKHSLNNEQLVWFRNGSALNTIRAKAS